MVAIERDAARITMAKHNAKVYGVAPRIDFRCGDCLALLPYLNGEANGSRKRTGASGQERGQEATAAAMGDVLFVDPPWGEDWNRTCTTLSDLPLLNALVQRVTVTSSAIAAADGGVTSTDAATVKDFSADDGNDDTALVSNLEAKKVMDPLSSSPQPQFKRLLAKVPPSFDPSTIPGAPRIEAWFGHEEGDYRRVKFLLLDLDLARELWHL